MQCAVLIPVVLLLLLSAPPPCDAAVVLLLLEAASPKIHLVAFDNVGSVKFVITINFNSI